MVDVEAVLLDELGRLSPFGGHEHADWADVTRRANVTLAGRRKLYLSLAAAFLLTALAAPALAFRAQIIDFLTAAPAPKSVVVSFGQLEVYESVPRGAGPGVIPKRARRVTSIRVGNATSALYVAPTKHGGFCSFWSQGVATFCSRTRQGTGPHGLIANLGWGAMTPSLGVDTIAGQVFSRDATIKLAYADGATTVIPYVWVTAPINAGFFLYAVPAGRRAGKNRPVALTVVRSGRTVQRQAIEDVSKTNRVVDHRDRWGLSLQTTPEAIWSKRRELFSFLLKDGTLAELFVMPSRNSPSRQCTTGTFEYGCEPRTLAGSPVQLSVGGTGRHGRAFLSGRVARRVARVELLYEDGARETVTPKDGFMLREIGSRHYQLGHRLVRAVGLDAAGRVVGKQTFDGTQRDLYPCAKPRPYGYGVTMCP
jgi:hypothetical protein